VYFQEFLQTVRINAEIKQVTWSEPTAQSDDSLIGSDPAIQMPSKLLQHDNGENLHTPHPTSWLMQDKPSYLKVNTQPASFDKSTS